MARNTTFRLTFWKLVFLLLMAGGLYATFIRFTQGLGASTHLSDQFPWGIWISFDVLCGVMLAAGGFTLTAAVHILNIKRLHSIIRPDDSYRVSRIHSRMRGADVRPRQALQHMAPADHAQSALGDV